MEPFYAPPCKDLGERRAAILAHATANGIDFVEVDAADHRILTVTFLKPLPPANPLDPLDDDDAYGLTADLSRITIEGGVRVVGVRVETAARQPDGTLRLSTNFGGDYSRYTLALEVPDLDPLLATIGFSFMATCPVDFDCKAAEVCPPEEVAEPRLDYLAKDYPSFVRFLLDLARERNPRFVETNPADLGVTLVELLAYVGDQLSYQQDAVANEAYLDTARQRISLARHARLVDYRLHQGRNAWAFVHLRVSAAGALPRGTAFTSRIHAPLAGTTQPPAVVFDPLNLSAQALEADPALSGVVVFESAFPAAFHPDHNELRLHAWGNEECCLPAGARELFLYSVAGGVAVRPALAAGDFLLLEEVRSCDTGRAVDADPERRQVVRIASVQDTEDLLFQAQLAPDGTLQRRVGAEPALPLQRVRLGRADALARPFCLSARLDGGDLLRDLTVARGNLVLADHGLTVREAVELPPEPADELPYRLRLPHGPLCFERRPAPAVWDPVTGRLASPRFDLTGGPELAEPAVTVELAFPSGAELWTPVPDLLGSSAFDRHFVAEIDNRGRAVLRFGDGQYGRRPESAAAGGATGATATWRVGNGLAGNVGAEALAHAAPLGGANWIEAVRNPLAGRDGTSPESHEEVRRRAPQAFRAIQKRAVTEADYTLAALELPEVAGAVASFRWTGSWYTVYVGIDPRDPADLLRLPGGVALLAPALAERVTAHLERYRIAGYDLDVRAPRYVPLELEVDLCVDPDHFRFDVVKAVLDALGSRTLPDGRKGFFHPDFFSFGQPVYLSRIYAAVEAVSGVESAVVRVFQRFDALANGELATGVLPIGAWEIARLDNDPSLPENGVLRVRPLGGKG